MRATWQCIRAEDEGFLPRSSLGSVVHDNTLYVWGGENKARHAIDTQLLSLDLSKSSPTWQVVDTKGSPPAERFAHTQGLVKTKDNEAVMYVFGGRQGVTMNEAALNDVHALDMKTKTWHQVTYSGTAPSARSFHAMTVVNTTLYVFGGCPDNHQPRSSELFAFDTTTSVWKQLPTGPMRGRGGTTLLPMANNTGLFMLGGFAGEETAEVWQFLFETEKWSLINENAFRARSVVAASYVGNTLIMFGGEVDASAKGHSGAGDFASDVLLLNAETGAVTSTQQKNEDAKASTTWPRARGWATASSLEDSSGLVLCGGLAGNDENPVRLGDVWVLTLKES